MSRSVRMSHIYFSSLAPARSTAWAHG